MEHYLPEIYWHDRKALLSAAFQFIGNDNRGIYKVFLMFFFYADYYYYYFHVFIIFLIMNIGRGGEGGRGEWNGSVD